MGIKQIQFVYHLIRPEPATAITGVMSFNLSYDDIAVMACVQNALMVSCPLVIIDVLWDWRMRTLEVWIKEEKARSLDRMAI